MPLQFYVHHLQDMQNLKYTFKSMFLCTQNVQVQFQRLLWKIWPWYEKLATFPLWIISEKQYLDRCWRCTNPISLKWDYIPKLLPFVLCFLFWTYFIMKGIRMVVKKLWETELMGFWKWISIEFVAALIKLFTKMSTNPFLFRYIPLHLN